MNNLAPAIITRVLSKRYGGSKVYALKDLSLKVKRGEIYGFLGPNGAGKSTTIRLLLNFIKPTGGSATILGKNIINDSVAIKKNIGYLSGEVALYPKMTGRQFLDYMAELQPPKDATYLIELKRRFQAETDVPIRSLSRGNRQKIGIIQAFMHQPDILILDEPTSGLDPLMQEEFFKLLHETKARRASVFLSSHNLSEVQRVCDRVGFIRAGRLIAEQNIVAVTARASKIFDVTFKHKVPEAELARLPRAKLDIVSDRAVTIHVSGDLSPLLKLLAGHDVMSINQRELNLEDEFLRFYSGGASSENGS